VVHALEELPGVRKASASHPGKVAIVLYDPASVTIEQMRQALFKAGYVASPKATNRTTQIVNHDESNEITDHRADDFVCYCFEYTRGDIEQDFIKNGRSLIIEKIAAEKKTRGCDCTNKNPEGK
jgi:copper chaperone CopZ